MESQIFTYYYHQRKPILVPLFGYSTKSVPGIEINGLGKFGKNIKEKIVFITRSRQLPIPVKRFVLCAELDTHLNPLDKDSVLALEFPLLIMYWYLAGLLPIQKLENCFAYGRLTPSGEIFETYQGDIYKNYELLPISHLNYQESFKASEILGHIPQLNFNHQIESVSANF